MALIIGIEDKGKKYKTKNKTNVLKTIDIKKIKCIIIKVNTNKRLLNLGGKL